MLNLETNKRHWLWLNYIQVLGLLLNMWPLVHLLTILVFIFLTCKLIIIILAVNIMANFYQWDNKSVSKLCMHAKLLQSCPTLCDPMDCSPPGSSVHEIVQARILEWVAIPSSRGSSQSRDQIHVSYVSCIGRQVLYHQCYLGNLLELKKRNIPKYFILSVAMVNGQILPFYNVSNYSYKCSLSTDFFVSSKFSCYAFIFIYL